MITTQSSVSLRNWELGGSSFYPWAVNIRTVVRDYFFFDFSPFQDLRRGGPGRGQKFVNPEFTKIFTGIDNVRYIFVAQCPAFAAPYNLIELEFSKPNAEKLGNWAKYCAVFVRRLDLGGCNYSSQYLSATKHSFLYSMKLHQAVFIPDTKTNNQIMHIQFKMEVMTIFTRPTENKTFDTIFVATGLEAASCWPAERD